MDKIVRFHFEPITKEIFQEEDKSNNDRLEDHFCSFIVSSADWCRDMSLFMLHIESMSNWHDSISSRSNLYRSMFSRRWKTMSSILSIDSFWDMFKQRWKSYSSLFINDQLDFIFINFLVFVFITFSLRHLITINQDKYFITMEFDVDKILKISTSISSLY